ncbi:MAG: glycerophosphodiester phosphodiesterase [Spirochaetes bacterium]|nr:glycerophosphodiester phosphodiesterase [Spirochaetota bacterium]
MALRDLHDGAGTAARFFTGFTPAAHRGASRDFPENTIPAFARAQEILHGCLLETDVRQTADGRIVIMHDELLHIKTDGSGPVRERDLPAVRALDAGFGVTFDGGVTYPFRGMGFRIPLLEEALDSFPSARFSIDIKDCDTGAAERVISIIRERDAVRRVIIGSFHGAVMRHVREKFRYAYTSYAKRDIVRFLAAVKTGMPLPSGRRGEAMLVPEMIGAGESEYTGSASFRRIRVVSPRFIRKAHRRSIPVIAWTINDPDNMRRLIEWGIDGIVTDRIDILKEVMAEKGLLPNISLTEK